MEIVGFRNEFQARERALRETKCLMYCLAQMNTKVFEDDIIQVGIFIQMSDIWQQSVDLAGSIQK